MTLDLTPTAADIVDAHEVLARNPGVETAAILGEVGGELTLARHAAEAGNTEGVAAAIRRAVALEETHRTRATDIRVLRRAAIMRSSRGVVA